MPEAVNLSGKIKEHTFYYVTVQLYKTNVAHHAILRVGFLAPDGNPGAHSEIWAAYEDGAIGWSDRIHRCDIVSEVGPSGFAPAPTFGEKE